MLENEFLESTTNKNKNNISIMNSLSISTVLHGRAYTYTIEKELGHGSYGITYLANTIIKVQGPWGMLETEMKVVIKDFFMRDLNGRNSAMGI